MAKQTTTTSQRVARAKMKLSAPVSVRVEIVDILLTETAAKRQPLRGDLPLNFTMNGSVHTKTDKKENTIQVQPRFTLTAKYDETDDDELLRIEAAFLLRYRVDSFTGLNKANFDAFGELNGLFNVWPYWREFVQSTTVRMGLPPLTLPVFRVPDVASTPGRHRPNHKPRARSGMER
ncbi:MAG: hypothetical protein ACE5F9_10825 [Phycisphaerae bacterium]